MLVLVIQHTNLLVKSTGSDCVTATLTTGPFTYLLGLSPFLDFFPSALCVTFKSYTIKFFSWDDIWHFNVIVLSKGSYAVWLWAFASACWEASSVGPGCTKSRWDVSNHHWLTKRTKGEECNLCSFSKVSMHWNTLKSQKTLYNWCSPLVKNILC